MQILNGLMQSLKEGYRYRVHVVCFVVRTKGTAVSIVIILAALSMLLISMQAEAKENSIEFNKTILGQQAGARTFKYHGNSFSLKFHKPSCPFAKAMNPNHLRIFPFRFQAIEAGLVPCRYCLPPFTKSVKAIIINHEKTTKELDQGSLSD